MSVQQRHRQPIALGLQDICLHLTEDGSRVSHDKAAGYRNLELTDGRTLSLQQIREPKDVHYPV